MILGIGIDLIEIDRIRSVGIERLAKRILTEQELNELSSASSERKLEFVAGRFVAKEAISKALGQGIGKVFSFQDAQIFSNEHGKPCAQLSSRTIDCLYPNKSISVHISITHSKDLASAVAIIEEL